MISVAPLPLPPFAGNGNQQLVSKVEVPSGQSLELHEVLVDNVGPEKWMRFRFLAPAIGKQPGDQSFADVENDFAYLCTALALPYLKEFGLSADVIAVYFLSEPVPFGESDPNVTQFVEVFRVSAGVCKWEGF